MESTKKIQPWKSAEHGWKIQPFPLHPIPTPAQESLGQESEEHRDVLQDLAQVNYGI